MEEHPAEEVRKYPVLYERKSTVGLSDGKNCFFNDVVMYNMNLKENLQNIK